MNFIRGSIRRMTFFSVDQALVGYLENGKGISSAKIEWPGKFIG